MSPSLLIGKELVLKRECRDIILTLGRLNFKPGRATGSKPLLPISAVRTTKLQNRVVCGKKCVWVYIGLRVELISQKNLGFSTFVHEALGRLTGLF